MKQRTKDCLNGARKGGWRKRLQKIADGSWRQSRKWMYPAWQKFNWYKNSSLRWTILALFCVLVVRWSILRSVHFSLHARWISERTLNFKALKVTFCLVTLYTTLFLTICQYSIVNSRYCIQSDVMAQHLDVRTIKTTASYSSVNNKLLYPEPNLVTCL